MTTSKQKVISAIRYSLNDGASKYDCNLSTPHAWPRAGLVKVGVKTTNNKASNLLMNAD